jgi:hypothetical protein
MPPPRRGEEEWNVHVISAMDISSSLRTKHGTALDGKAVASWDTWEQYGYLYGSVSADDAATGLEVLPPSDPRYFGPSHEVALCYRPWVSTRFYGTETVFVSRSSCAHLRSMHIMARND